MRHRTMRQTKCRTQQVKKNDTKQKRVFIILMNFYSRHEMSRENAPYQNLKKLAIKLFQLLSSGYHLYIARRNYD